MNAPIARLFVVCVVLFGVLVGFTSRWTVFQADALRDNPKNRRELLEEQKIRRGLIRAADDTVLARSLKQADDSYVRTYPPGRLFSHAVGYSYVRQGRAGLERFYDDQLTGRKNELGSLLDRLSGSEQEGDNLITALDPAAQRVALQQLGGRKGAVVALDPRNGAIRVMASVPGYDPNTVKDQRQFSRSTATRTRRCSTATPSRAIRRGRPSRSSRRSPPSTPASTRPTRASAGATARSSRASPSTTTRASPSATSR